MKISSGKFSLVASCALFAAGCSESATTPAEPTPAPAAPVTSAGSAAVGAPRAGTVAGIAGRAAVAGSSAVVGAAGAPGRSGAAGSAAGSAAAASGSGAAGSAGVGQAGAAADSGGTGGAVSAGSGAGAGGSGQAGSEAGAGGGAGAAAGSGGSGTTVQPGNGGVVNATIVVGPGMTFDGGGKRYTAGRALGDGSQSESQQPVFRVEKGGRLMNVVLGSPAADGVHCYGDATLENIVWEDIGEDAMTIKESGTVTLNGGSASNGDDKVFQINAASTFKVSNFKARNAGKFIRQNGGTTFKVAVEIDKCDISNMDEAIFRTDSSSSTVKMTNTRYSNIGDDLFIGVSSGNIQQSGNTEY